MISSQWLPPISESLSRQLEEHNFSTNIKNLTLKVPAEEMINGETVIEMAHTRHINEEKKREEDEMKRNEMKDDEFVEILDEII